MSNIGLFKDVILAQSPLDHFERMAESGPSFRKRLPCARFVAHCGLNGHSITTRNLYQKVSDKDGSSEQLFVMCAEKDSY